MKRSPKIWRARWLQSQHFWSGVGWLLPCSFMGLVLRFKVDPPGGSLCPLLFLAGFSELAWMQLYVFQNFNPLYLITWNPQTLSWACVAVVQTNWRKKERREGGGEARDWERENESRWTDAIWGAWGPALRRKIQWKPKGLLPVPTCLPRQGGQKAK